MGRVVGQPAAAPGATDVGVPPWRYKTHDEPLLLPIRPRLVSYAWWQSLGGAAVVTLDDATPLPPPQARVFPHPLPQLHTHTLPATLSTNPSCPTPLSFGFRPPPPPLLCVSFLPPPDMAYVRRCRGTPAGAASAASATIFVVAVVLVAAAAALSVGVRPAAATAVRPASAAAAATVPPASRVATDAVATVADGDLLDPVDRRQLVKLFAAISATKTWFTRPDDYGFSDGAGGVGGVYSRTKARAKWPAAVVTIHGLGSSGAHAVDRLREDLPAATLAYTSLYGPSAGTDAAGTYRSWFPIGSVGFGKVPASDGPAGAGADLAATVARIDRVIAATGVPRGRVVLVGFSQGAATVIDYILAGRAKGLAGVVLSAGWVPRPARARRPRGAAGLRVLIAHGRWDWLVPVRSAGRVAKALRAVGAKVSVRRYWDDHFFSDHAPFEKALAAFIQSAVPL